MKQNQFSGAKTGQFTREDVARISAAAINAVLEKLSIQQIIEAIAVLPAGEGVYLVDLVMRDLTVQDTWSLTLTVPPSQAEARDRD